MKMKLFRAAVGVGVAALLQPVQAKEDVVRVLEAENTDFGSIISAVFSTSQLDSSLTPTDSPTVHPLKGTPLPKKCEDEINNGRALSKFCTTWLEVNDDFIMPTHSPSEAPSAAPSPFYKVESSTFVDDNDRPSLVLDISPVDDTFIELFRPDIPLGDKTNVKIDAMVGVPTKVTMLKFNIGQSLNQILLNQHVGVSLKSARLQLYAKATGTRNQFGGYVEEIDANWSEETAVWDDYVRGGPAAKKDAENLLPSANHTLASLEAVSSSTWAEADVTERLREIAADWSNSAVSSQFAVRISTNSSEGVVYGSKEDIEFGPKLSLVFEFEGTSLEVAAAAAAANNHGETTITSKPTLRATSSPSSPPTPNPTVATNSPVAATASPVAATASPVVTTPPPSTSSPVVNTQTPSANPTRAPSPLPTPSPTSAEVTEEPTETSAAALIPATSVVTQMFQLNIVATTEEVRERNLKGSRQLSFFMSANEKERPALEEHLLNVYNETLTSSPERVEIMFANDDMDVEIVSSNKVVRSSKFKISAIFIDPRIASIAANEASAVLDRATLHAFTGAENTAFVSILKETGEPIISSSEQITVAVSKMSFSIGNMSDQNAQAATTPETSVDTRNERSNDEVGWAGPALAIGASLVVVACALASFILIRQRRNHYSYDEKHKNANNPMSPTNTEAVTPSPTSFTHRFRKKKFDYTEFDDLEDQSTSHLEYDFNPVTPQKFDKKQPADFDCPPDINFSHFQCRSFDDSTVSDVSAHIYARLGRSPRSHRNATVADGDKSGIESEQFRFDNVLGNDNDLEVDGVAPDFLVDDDSASAGDVPSALYSIMSMDDSTSIQSHALPAVYGANAFMLENMIKATDASFMDMPAPPSGAASENSSQDFPSDPFYGNDEGDTFEPCSDESYFQKTINDELTKVMMILNTDDDKMEEDGDDNSVDLGSIDDEDVRAVTPIYDVPLLQGAFSDESVQSSVQSEDDPVKLMNSALDDCMSILDKARPTLT